MSQDHMKKWAVAGIAALLLFVTAITLHNAGWSQGFAMGLLAGNTDSAQIAPYLAYRAGHGGFFGFFGVIFRFGFFLLFLALIAKFFGFWRWRMLGHGGPGWGHHGYYRDHHGRERGEHSQEQQASQVSSTEREPQNTGWTNI